MTSFIYLPMERKTIVKIAVCFLLSIAFIVYLQQTSVGPNQQKNHFIRIFPPHFMGMSKSYDLKNPDYYIVGLTAGSIFLGNYTDPEHLLIVHLNLLDTENFKMPIPDSVKVIPSVLHWSMDNSNLYLDNYALGSVYKFPLSNPKDQPSSLLLPEISNSVFLPFPGRTFAIRTFDKNLQENILAKISVNSPLTRKYSHILQKQEEGIFSTDGMLRFNADAARFVYTYFYRNQFICLDTDFNIQYRAQTLDTNTVAKIRVVRVVAERTATIASPGFRVTRAACINRDWILINSDLLADNEEKNMFTRYAVIDMYGIKNGHYHFSFYLPKGAGKITDMAMMGNSIITIQDHTLFYYRLNIDGIKER